MASPAPCELWSNDTFDRDRAPVSMGQFESVESGLSALWHHTLERGVRDGGGSTLNQFALHQGGARWSIPRDPVQNPELAYLRFRRHEKDFAARLAALHATLPSFGFAAFLALPALLPDAVMNVVRPLAMVLSLTAEPVSAHDGWRCGRPEAVHLLMLASAPDHWSIRTCNLDQGGTTVNFAVFIEGASPLRIESDRSPGALTLYDALIGAS